MPKDIHRALVRAAGPTFQLGARKSAVASNFPGVTNNSSPMIPTPSNLPCCLSLSEAAQPSVSSLDADLVLQRCQTPPGTTFASRSARTGPPLPPQLGSSQLPARPPPLRHPAHEAHLALTLVRASVALRSPAPATSSRFCSSSSHQAENSGRAPWADAPQRAAQGATSHSHSGSNSTATSTSAEGSTPPLEGGPVTSAPRVPSREPPPSLPSGGSDGAPTPVGPGPPALTLPAGNTAVLAVRSRADSARLSLQRAGASLLAAAVDLGVKLNQVTGYSVIEQLKIKVDEATRRLHDAREELRESKAAYEALVSEQGDVQRQQMALLQRKGSWQAADLERFTELCREEHRLEMEVVQAKAAYGEAAEDLEACHDQVAEAVRERYSAETLWSDKIRRASTWWTVALMGLNLVSFLSVYLVMEPIKARRLRNHVEEVMRQEMANMRAALASLEASMRSQAGDADAPTGVGLGAVQAAGASGVVAAREAGQGGGAGPLEGGRLERLDLLHQLRQVKLHLAAVEQGLAGAGSQVGSAAAGQPGAHAEVLQAPRGGTGSSGASPWGLASLGPTEEPAWASAGGEEEVERETAERDADTSPSASSVWYRGLGFQLRRALATPEVTTAAAAFLGATLGVGMLLLLRGDN